MAGICTLLGSPQQTKASVFCHVLRRRYKFLQMFLPWYKQITAVRFGV